MLRQTKSASCQNSLHFLLSRKDENISFHIRIANVPISDPQRKTLDKIAPRLKRENCHIHAIERIYN